MSALAAAALGAVYALGAWLAWDLARANLRHGHHAARHVFHAAERDVQEAGVFYGSMQLAEERDWFTPALHHELPWRELTLAELSPEALETLEVMPGGPVATTKTVSPGLGGGFLSSPPPSPDPDPQPLAEFLAGERAWVDGFLVDFYAWLQTQLEARA